MQEDYFNMIPPSPISSFRPPSPQIYTRPIMTNEKNFYFSLFQLSNDSIPTLPRIVPHQTTNSKTFTLPQTTPLSSRSPSVASSWCSYDSDYEDGLVIEEITSDDEILDDSDVEVIEGEYEDPPSDDDEFWTRWRHRQELNDTHEVIVSGFGDMSTSVRSPDCVVEQSPLLYTPPIFTAPSTSSKRNFVDSDTDEEATNKEDSRSSSGRRTRRKIAPRARTTSRVSAPTQVIRGFNTPTPRESEMLD